MGQQTGGLKGMREMDCGFAGCARESYYLYAMSSRGREIGLDLHQCS